MFALLSCEYDDRWPSSRKGGLLVSDAAYKNMRSLKLKGKMALFFHFFLRGTADDIYIIGDGQHRQRPVGCGVEMRLRQEDAFKSA